MYPRYNMYQNRNIMRNNRFVGGGFLAPFLLGGIAGYAFGSPNFGRPFNYYNNSFYNSFYNPYPFYFYR